MCQWTWLRLSVFVHQNYKFLVQTLHRQPNKQWYVICREFCQCFIGASLFSILKKTLLLILILITMYFNQITRTEEITQQKLHTWLWVEVILAVCQAHSLEVLKEEKIKQTTRKSNLPTARTLPWKLEIYILLISI